MSLFHTVLFDLDGTLTDPAEGITASLAHALEKMGVPVPEKSFLTRYIGPPLLDSFAVDFHFSEEESLRALRFYREYFTARGIFENAMYDGIPTLLKALKERGITVSLATSKPEPYAVRILEHFGIAEYFDYVAGSTLDEKRSKKEEVIRYALDSLGVAAEKTIAMVGDREYDIFGARAVGITPIGVSYGYGTREELEKAGATDVAESVSALAALLLTA